MASREHSVSSPPRHGPWVRAGRREDVAAVADIWRAGWREAHHGRVPDDLVKARTASSFLERATDLVGATTVAVVSGEIAGFVMVAEDEVQQLYVAPGHRGGVVARALLSAAEAVVAGRGHAEAWLAVVAGNARARRFYEGAGWRDLGQFDYAATGPRGPITVPAHRYVRTVRSG